MGVQLTVQLLLSIIGNIENDLHTVTRAKWGGGERLLIKYIDFREKVKSFTFAVAGIDDLLLKCRAK